MIDKIVKKIKYIRLLLSYYSVLIKFFLFSKLPVFFKQIKLIIRELLKLIKSWPRKIYVWQVLSVRNRWYLSQNKNHYNPTLEATVYQWGEGWNIARFNIHYQGYKTKKRAQEAAFKMWMQERLKKKNVLKPIGETYKPSLQKELSRTESIKEPCIGFIFENGCLVLV